MTVGTERHVLGVPLARGRIRTQPEDFKVYELTHVVPSGAGEHALLRVRKKGLDTAAVAGAIARHAGVSARDVGFAGRKDRHAVTEQWFSVGLAGRSWPDWDALSGNEIAILEAHRHERKLRTGALTGNRFEIVVRELADDDDLEARLQAIRDQGAPNYFGPQRFGRGGSNLNVAMHWFSSGRAPRRREARSMALSAARAQVFNATLSARIASGCWNTRIPGDVFALSGSRGVFADDGSDELALRLAQMDIHPTGPLPGRGDVLVTGQALALELEAAEPFGALIDGLKDARVDAARRALRMRVDALDWTRGAGTLTLGFELAAGCFATSVLRELIADHDTGAGGHAAS